MKRTLTLFVIAAAALAAAQAQATPACTPKPGLAPADEYFGYQALSPLDVPIHIAFDANHFSATPNKDPNRQTAQMVLKDGAGIENAVAEIEYCYPQDTVIPQAVSGLYSLYREIGPAGAQRAAAMKTWLETKYPAYPLPQFARFSSRLRTAPIGNLWLGR